MSYRERIEPKKLKEMIEEAITLYIDDELVEQLLSELILENQLIDRSRAELILDYLRHPTVEGTQEIMRGMVSL